MSIEAAAAFLLAAHRAGRHFERLPADIAPRSENEAYRVQEALIAGLSLPVAGWKVALTSAAMRRVVPGIDQPCAGAIFAERVHHAPARLPRAALMHIGIECEAMVRLAGDLPDTGRPWTRESVAGHVGAVAAAFELIDDRNADYNNMNAFELIADNAWNGGAVVGPEVSDWRARDLAGAHGSLEIDGRFVGEGRGGDAMGHPFEPLAWLANNAITRGRPLRAGEIVMTGSIIPTQFLETGSRAVYIHEALGQVALEIV